MNDNVIYFPHMEVPNSDWFNQILLYWDNVYSIVPMREYEILGSDDDKHMVKLCQNGLINVIHPESHDFNFDYFDGFLKYIKSQNYPVTLNNPQKWESSRLIHEYKFRNEFLDELIQMGLAKKKSHYWYELEGYTADQYMAFLAGYFGQLPEYNATPITDLKENVDNLQLPYETQHINTLRNETRDIIFKNILPSPLNYVNPEKIAQFKDKNYDELIRFRRGLETKIIDIVNIQDPFLRNERLKLEVEEAQYEIGDLSEKMENSGLGNIIRNNWAVLSVSLTSGLNASNTMDPINLFQALATTALALNKIHSDYNVTNEIIDSNYYVYAVLANREIF